MLKRDFSKSNKEYFKQNKWPLIIFGLVLLLGLICAIAFGFNGNFEMKGYTEFSVLVQNADSKTISKYEKEISSIVNQHNGDFDYSYLEGEGDSTKLVIRYNKTLKNSEQLKINEEIMSKLGIEIDEGQEASFYVSNHNFVSPVVKGSYYLYTAVAILLIVAIATIFALFRYDGACAITTFVNCLLGTMLFLTFSSVLRLEIGLSYFAMLVILNVLIIYCSFTIFEDIRETSWLQSKEYSTALETALKTTRSRMLFVGLAQLVIGLLFVVVAPSNLKFVAVNILFMAVTVLFVAWYVLPFVWSALITHANIKRFKTKTKKTNIEE